MYACTHTHTQTNLADFEPVVSRAGVGAFVREALKLSVSGSQGLLPLTLQHTQGGQ